MKMFVGRLIRNSRMPTTVYCNVRAAPFKVGVGFVEPDTQVLLEA